MSKSLVYFLNNFPQILQYSYPCISLTNLCRVGKLEIPWQFSHRSYTPANYTFTGTDKLSETRHHLTTLKRQGRESL